MKSTPASIARAASAKSLSDAFRETHQIELKYDPKRFYTDAGHRGWNSTAYLAFVEATVLIDGQPFAVTVSSAHMSAFLWTQSGDADFERAAARFRVAATVLVDGLDPILEPLEDKLIEFLPTKQFDLEL